MRLRFMIFTGLLLLALAWHHWLVREPAKVYGQQQAADPDLTAESREPSQAPTAN